MSFCPSPGIASYASFNRLSLDQVHTFADITSEGPRQCWSNGDCPNGNTCIFPPTRTPNTWDIPGACTCKIDRDCAPGNPGQCGANGQCGTPWADVLRKAYGNTTYPDDPNGTFVYDNVDAVDLWMGLMSEAPADNSPFGWTHYWMLYEQFRVTRDNDAYFYLAPGIYTAAQLAWVQSRNLTSIIVDNLTNCATRGAAACGIPLDVFQM